MGVLDEVKIETGEEVGEEIGANDKEGEDETGARPRQEENGGGEIEHEESGPI